MKLAEALALRADLNTRLHALANRAALFSRTQEGSSPEEDPTELLAEHDRVLNRLEELVVQINETNLRISVSDGVSMTAALARRDTLRDRHKLLTRVANEASVRPDRHTRTELRTVAVVDVKQTRSDADRVATQLRELDTRIQEVNWLSELQTNEVQANN
jgi:hypothetical protein